jgi:3-methyladenine DNA glycosylase Mpg
MLGVLLALGALASWTVGDFFIQRTSRKLGIWKALFFITILGAIVLFPFRQSERIRERFFARDAATVAQDLLGRTLVMERPHQATLYARICEVAAYQGSTEESMTEYARAAPGTIAVSTKYGKQLLDIATEREGKLSCITLRGAIIGDKRGIRERIEGPGKLCETLGIEKELNGTPLGRAPFWIGGKPVEKERIQMRNLTDVPLNCVGYYYFK